MVKQKAKAKPKKPSVPRKPKVKKPKVEKVKELKPPKKKDVVDKLYRERLLRAKGSLGPRSTIFGPKDRQPVLDDKRFDEKLDYLYRMLLLASHKPPRPQRPVAMDISESEPHNMSDVPAPREAVSFPQEQRTRRSQPLTRERGERKSERSREQKMTSSESDSASPPPARPSQRPKQSKSSKKKDSTSQTLDSKKQASQTLDSKKQDSASQTQLFLKRDSDSQTLDSKKKDSTSQTLDSKKQDSTSQTQDSKKKDSTSQTQKKKKKRDSALQTRLSDLPLEANEITRNIIQTEVLDANGEDRRQRFSLNLPRAQSPPIVPPAPSLSLLSPDQPDPVSVSPSEEQKEQDALNAQFRQLRELTDEIERREASGTFWKNEDLSNFIFKNPPKPPKTYRVGKSKRRPDYDSSDAEIDMPSKYSNRYVPITEIDRSILVSPITTEVDRRFLPTETKRTQRASDQRVRTHPYPYQ
jgi:hypothetical protein